MAIPPALRTGFSHHACNVEGPAVKGTLQGVAHHNAAHAQMRSHVGAEGMGNSHLA